MLQLFLRGCKDVIVSEPRKGARKAAETTLKNVLAPEFPGWVEVEQEEEPPDAAEAGKQLKDFLANSRVETAEIKEERTPEIAATVTEDVSKSEWSNFQLHRSSDVSKKGCLVRLYDCKSPC